MGDITKLKSKVALEKLREYEGENEYLKSLKLKLDRHGYTSLTTNQVQYILRTHDKEPTVLNKVVEITEFFGENLKETYELSFVPEKVLVESVLDENEKSYHVKGKLFKNQKSPIIFYIPRTQLIKDIYEEEYNVDVDFDKYIDTGRKPFPHQEEGIKFLLSKKKCILADDMGLGKTTQAIISALESESEKILIVCPANAKINWMREIMLFGVPQEDISILKSGYWNPKKFTIINYDILSKFHTLVDGRKSYKESDLHRHLTNEGFDLIIADECHMLKNPKSQTAKVITEVAVGVERIWLLTGTPVANRPMDYFNLLKLCESPVTANWQYYAFRYCDAKKFKKKTKNGALRTIWITDGASNLDELFNRTRGLILRRKKEDHLDLPPKIISPYFLELENMDKYNSVFDEYLEWAKSEGKKLGAGRHMVELIVLRKFIAEQKVKHTIEMAEEMIENGKKLIIFTNFTNTFDMLIDHFGKIAVGHNGRMNDKQKQNSIDQFQNNDKIKVFVGNLISAGTAITLTEATAVIMNDLDWVPANHEQAEDRCYRIGQSKTVNIYYPVFDETIDVMMYNLLQKKKGIINTIMGEEVEEVDIMDDFLGSLSGKF
jgi:SWI/SNF-related matrix-associated actin-dependent regulator 1 of chromatin subfamily A